MIKYVDGTVFNQKVDAIVNTINTVGVMGAGLALEFSLRYPDMLKDYENKCKLRQLTTGQVDYYRASDTLIINFPTKWHFKYPSKLEWIEEGLQNFADTYATFGIKSVAFPRLGVSNGGLEWSDVKILMEKYLDPLDILVLICLDRKEAEGLEREMVDRFNATDFTRPIDGVKLNKNQVAVLENAKPVDRFFRIKELDGIGITCYTKLYRYFQTEKLPHTVEQYSFEF